VTAENITPEISIEVKSGEEISPQFSTPNLSDLATSDHAPRWEWRIVVETVNGAENFLLTSVFHDGEKIAKMQTPSEISQWNLDDLRAEMHEMVASFSKPFIRRTFPGIYTEEPCSWMATKDGVEPSPDLRTIMAGFRAANAAGMHAFTTDGKRWALEDTTPTNEALIRARTALDDQSAELAEDAS